MERSRWLRDILLPLYVGRALRSLSQGYLAIIVPLYLLSLGYTATAVGLLIAVGAGSGALLTLAVGSLADRVGRKPILAAFGLLTAMAGVVFATQSNFLILAIAGALGTIGQGGGVGSGGAFGPYFVAEQALTAELSGDEKRTAVFARLSLVGTIGSILGAGIAVFPARPLFWCTGLLGVALALVVLPIRERRTRSVRILARTPLASSTWALIRRFMITNATNGLAIGFLGPILVLWFHERYAANVAQISVLYTAINLLSILSYLGVTRIVRAIGGAVRTVVFLRILSCVLLAVVPFSPTFMVAGIIYGVRMLVNIVTFPVRQSYSMGIIPASERSRASALSNFPARVSSMGGPLVAGALIDHAWIGLPLELASALQLLNAGLYWAFFRNLPPPEEIEEAI
ncbi:MAG TPA: MFS transporter [Candidatus Dormibacteraeota bacterium]|nr:MFS transporter [Candidatus Dormibacteraeota bacterium]